MFDWTVDEHKTAGGQSHFAEFVAGLTDTKDIKDAAVLTGALRALGNQLREPRSKSLTTGYLNSAAPGCGYTMDSCRAGARYCSEDMSRSGQTLPSKYSG